MNGSKLHEYQGPHDIRDKTFRHVNRRAIERKHRMENINAATFHISSDITQQEYDTLLREIEPPWSWIHQFATMNCRDKSHNFLEMQSIASDETPAESSDESFDFENNQFYVEGDTDKSESSDNCSALEDMLLLDESAVENRIVDHSVQDVVNISGLISDIINIVQTAVAQKEIDLKNAASIRSFLSNTNDPKLSKLDLRAVQKAIQIADDAKIEFKCLSELELYLRKEMNYPEKVKPMEDSSIASTTTLLENISITILPTATAQNEKLQPTIDDSVAPLVHAKPLESQFDDCQIEIDEKIANKPIPDLMILGLIGTPPPTPIIIPTPPRTPTPTPPSPYNTSSGIITENVSLHDFPPPLEPLVFLPPPPAPEKLPFQCRVPPMSGIGPAVSKEAIQNVLTYLKGRSRNEKGLVYPRHFLEAKCPNIVNTYEG